MFVCSTATHVLVHSPAKLNLFLEVLARRADGFHEIETLMGAVTICDTLEFAPRKGGELRLSCRWAGGLMGRSLAARCPAEPAPLNGFAEPLGDLPTGDENIVQRAVQRLRRQAAVLQGAEIRLTKRIPSAAGLGGASSDAAAALVAANVAWRLGWSHKRLRDLAAELGSDIPFFLGSRWAVCRGRGERIEPVCGSRLHVVVVRPPQGLATADVYGGCRPAKVAALVRPLQRRLAAGDWRLREHLFNRLEESAAGLNSWINRLKAALDRLGCVASQMSGSGSSCFGICRSARHAGRVTAQLRSMELGTVYQATSGGAWSSATESS
jgi:4-diphosphocytidyl-2-C-methyl-D-erythritol kinase